LSGSEGLLHLTCGLACVKSRHRCLLSDSVSSHCVLFRSLPASQERFRALLEQGIAKEKIVDALIALQEGAAATGMTDSNTNDVAVADGVEEVEVNEQVEMKEPTKSKQDKTTHPIEKSSELVDSPAQKEEVPSSAGEATPIKIKSGKVAEESDSNSDSDGSSSDSDSEEEELVVTNRRSRGCGNKKRKQVVVTPKEPEEEIYTEKEVAKPDEKKGPRRCLGRKPVTDFEMWESYEGKVVYLKPFGAFIDIGCHSDAFCHVSRTRDEFAQNIHDVLQVGDTVKGRVTEIDRSRKRITISLQSTNMIEIEMKAYQKHQNNLQAAGSEAAASSTTPTAAQTQSPHSNQSFAAESGIQKTALHFTPSTVRSTPVPPKAQQESHSRNVLEIDDSRLDKAELKRKRKLERRADRREKAVTAEE
jgi:predicted RNA-binding protein with RPS1 domain